MLTVVFGQTDLKHDFKCCTALTRSRGSDKSRFCGVIRFRLDSDFSKTILVIYSHPLTQNNLMLYIRLRLYCPNELESRQ